MAALLETAEDDLLAFYSFPADHWRKLRSTNPLERLNREIGLRDVRLGAGSSRNKWTNELESA